jgi:hypothetical protein
MAPRMSYVQTQADASIVAMPYMKLSGLVTFAAALAEA